MTTKLNEKRFDGVAYVTPSIFSLDIKSEGLLCMSSPKNTIDDATVVDWGTF